MMIKILNYLKALKESLEEKWDINRLYVMIFLQIELEFFFY